MHSCPGSAAKGADMGTRMGMMAAVVVAAVVLELASAPTSAPESGPTSRPVRRITATIDPPPVRDLDTPLQPLEAHLEPLASQALLTPPEGHGMPAFEPPGPYTIAAAAPRISVAAYPVDYRSRWAHWGPGCIHSNGKVYTAIGDHGDLGADSYLYEYDPATNVLRRAASLRQGARLGLDSYGCGKVHGQVCEGADGRLYMASWWGNNHDAYEGDRLFSYDVTAGTLEHYGITVGGFGAPSTAMNADGGLFYGVFFCQQSNADAVFVAYDLARRRVVFQGGHHEAPRPGRGIGVDAKGRAYFSSGRGHLQVYDPARNLVEDFPAAWPCYMTRAFSVRKPADGTLLVAGQGEGSPLMRLDGEARTLTPLATLWTDVRSFDLDPSGRYVYYLACNSAGRNGTYVMPTMPLVRLDLQDGTQQVVAFLQQAFREQLDLQFSGESTCYSTLVSDDGRTIYLCLNTAKITFDEDNPTMLYCPVFVKVELP